VKVRPSTLSADFIRGLFAATGGGRGRSFEDVRDHALVRLLCEGLRRTEIVQMRLAIVTSEDPSDGRCG
jgi:hypothetical protein